MFFGGAWVFFLSSFLKPCLLLDNKLSPPFMNILDKKLQYFCAQVNIYRKGILTSCIYKYSSVPKRSSVISILQRFLASAHPVSFSTRKQAQLGLY